MGTSQSKPSLGGGKPLVPSWGDQDPAPPPDPQAADQEAPAVDPQAPGGAEPPEAPPNADPLPPRPLAGTRRALRDYYGSGSPADARRAAGRFARSVGAGGARRYARATRTGGAALAAMARAASGLEPRPGSLDLRDLNGRPVEEAIGEIVDAFCPPGILDEEATRLAIGEALFEALGHADIFDPEAINDLTLVVASRCFVAELVFASLAAEAGKAADNVSPAVAVAREKGLRDLIREVADVVGTEILQNAGPLLTPQVVEGVVAQVTNAVLAEMRQWQ